MSAVPALPTAVPLDGPRGLPLPLHDAASRLFAVTRLIAAIESSDQEALGQLLASGLSPAMLERLRSMSLGEVWRLASAPCGLSLLVDSQAMSGQIQRMDRARADQETLEYLVRHGATPRLLMRWFRLSETDVGQLRKALAPERALGGRPPVPDDDERVAIEQAWARLSDEPCQRTRLRRLHEQFAARPVASLERVLQVGREPGAGALRRWLCG